MTTKIGITLLIVCFFVHFASAQSLSDWRYDRTGVYKNETGLLEKWPEDGPTMLWANQELFPGHSSVSIAHNTIYLTGKQDSMDVVMALTMDGKLKWKTPYGLSWEKSYNDSRSTPMIDGKRLYMTSGNGHIACVDAVSGNIIWKVDAHKKFNGVFHKWGIAESPIIYNNKVFYTVGGPETMMVALDKMTGETIWKTKSLDDSPSYASPLLIEHKGEDYIIQVSINYVFSVKPENGEIMWKFKYGQFAGGSWRANNNTNTPLYSDGTIFITNGYDHKAVMLELDNKDPKKVYFKYDDDNLDVHHGGAVKVGDYIYGANWINNGNGNWVCLNWETGEKMYEKEWQNKGSIISAEGKLYCYDEKRGNVALVEATPEAFKIISSFKVPHGRGPHWSHPVIRDGVLYVRHGEALMAYDIKAK